MIYNITLKKIINWLTLTSNKGEIYIFDSTARTLLLAIDHSSKKNNKIKAFFRVRSIIQE